MTSANLGPLAGIAVLDFAGFIAGAYTATMLGEMGASVVKVEAVAGDPARHWGPFYAGESKFFQGWNRNKRGIALDLTSAEGRRIIHALAAKADVVIENFRPGVADKLGIGAEELRALNPRLIHCSSTGFGPKGPDRLRPAYDPILQSMSGSALANVRFSGVVGISSAPFTDFHTAMLGLSGILAALFHRERTGEGQHLETSLLQGALNSQAHCFVKPLRTPEEGPTGIYPYRLFRSSDGHIFIAAPTDKFWRILCGAIGLPELGTDPAYKSNRDRVARQEELTPKLQAVFETKPTREWEALLLAADVPCGPVQGFDAFLESPQVTAMEMNPVVEHPTIGPIRMGGPGVTFEKTPSAVRRAAPRLGEHTREVLDEAGFGAEEIAGWFDRGIVAGPR